MGAVDRSRVAGSRAVKGRVCAVARFYRDVKPRALGRDIEKQPLVIDLKDIGAKLTQYGRDRAEHTRPVRYGETERNDVVLALEFVQGKHQPALDDFLAGLGYIAGSSKAADGK